MLPEDNENDKEVREIIILRPRRLAILKALFVRPTQGLLAAQFHSCWVPALLCTILAFLLASFQRGLREVREFSPRVKSIVSLVAKDVAPVSFEDGKMRFSEKLEYPYNRVEDGWQINVVAPGEKAVIPEKKDAVHGLVFSENALVYWFNYAGKSAFSQEVLDGDQVAKLAKAMRNNGSSSLDYDGIMAMASACLMLCVPVMGIYIFVGLLFTLLVTLLMFWVAMLLLRPETRSSKKGTFVLMVNCLMPPALLASFWYCFVPLSFEFSHVFLLAAVAYLVLIFFDARRKVEE